MAFTFDEGSAWWAFFKILFGIFLFFLLPKYYFYRSLINYNYPDGLFGELIDSTADYEQKSFVERQKEKIDNIKRNDDTVYNDVNRFINPKYY
ncbi:cell division protein FtsK, partial [Staphylococcus warneri]